MDCIKIWQFDKAPLKYRELSCHGGDEDFVVVMTVEEYESNPYADLIVQKLTVCDSEQYCIVEGGKRLYVFITSHA